MHSARRTTLTFVTAAALAAAALVGSSAVQAADVTPTSDAVVRMDTGTAYAKEVGKNRYRITLPADASIQWMGQPKGDEAPPIGSLTGKGLTRAWSSLGHRADVGVPTRVTWQASGHDWTDWRSGFVTRPRLNDAGRLVVTFETERGRLPKTLPDFSINVSPASERARTTYPTTFGNIKVSGTSNMALSITANSKTSATLRILMLNPTTGTWDPCDGVPNPVITMGGTSRNDFYYGPQQCSNVYFESGNATYMGWFPGKSGAVTQVLPCYRVQVPKGNSGLSYCADTVSWS